MSGSGPDVRQQDFIDDTFLNGTNAYTGRAGSSVNAFATALVTGLGLAAIQVALFLLLREHRPEMYMPKTFLVPKREQTETPRPGIWNLLRSIFRRADDDFLKKSGPDGFFLCRYLLVLLKILTPMSLATIILVPINTRGGNNHLRTQNGTVAVTQGLQVYSIANISEEKYHYIWAHCIIAVAGIFWTCWVIFDELRAFVRIRQGYLASPQHRLRASASTVLVQSLSSKYLDKTELENLFDIFPGGIRNVWINRDYSSLTHLIEERNDAAKALEKAETKLIKKCVASNKKKSKKTGVVAGQVDGASGNLTTGGSSWVGFNANDPEQVHHTVVEAVSALRRAEESRNIKSGKQGISRRLGAVAQGVQTIGRGLVKGDPTVVRFSSVRKSIRRRPGTARSTDSDPVAGSTSDSSSPQIPSASDKELAPRSSGNETVEPETQGNASPQSSYQTGSAESRNVSLDTEKAEPLAYNPEFEDEKNLTAKWRTFIQESDRPTMRIKMRFKWLPWWLNPWNKKVDKIYHLRKRLAELNKSIEERQSPVWEDQYPKLNSAFIQFNNQAAAHMACQSVAHHVPRFMNPRLVEVAPNDIIWRNMAVTWWGRSIRTVSVTILLVALIILWTIPIALLGIVAQSPNAFTQIKQLAWVGNISSFGLGIIQGPVAVLLLILFVFLLGLVLRQVIRLKGAPTQGQVELSTQKWFFAFAFIQYFLIVLLSGAFASLLEPIKKLISASSFDISIIPALLATKVPAASSYFLQSIPLQSFSQSAAGLMRWDAMIPKLWGSAFGTMARQKFKRRTNLPATNRWGTQWPIYTTFACITIIYSVAAPLILPLACFGFFVWWLSMRYQVLYVYRYRVDTGGQLFPKALKQLFTGIYLLELFLVGYTTTIATASDGAKNLIPLPIMMGTVFFLTVIFHYILKKDFDPLLTYLPITLEDGAAERDEQFARLLASPHDEAEETQRMSGVTDGDLPAQLDDEKPPPEHKAAWRSGGRASTFTDEKPATEQLNGIGILTDDPDTSPIQFEKTSLDQAIPEGTEAQFDGRRSGSQKSRKHLAKSSKDDIGQEESSNGVGVLGWVGQQLQKPVELVAPNDAEATARLEERSREANILYGNIPADLEDLAPDSREALVGNAYLHSAIRAKRPCIWIPRDAFGVSDDEVLNTQQFTRWIWINNERHRIDEHGKVKHQGPPPDYDEVDLIQL